MSGFQPLSTRDMRILVATVHYEAGGEIERGKAAVAQVIVNRAFNPRWWTGGGAGPVERACFARAQFSCWNTGKAKSLALLFIGGDPDKGWINEEVARASRDAVRVFLSGDIDTSDVRFCAHYINPETAPRVGNALRGWARNWKEGVQIGAHAFLQPGQLSRPEKPIQPVDLYRTPAVRIEDAHWIAVKASRLWRRWGGRIVTLLTTAWAGLVAAIQGDPSILTGLHWRDALPVIFIAATALVVWQIVQAIINRPRKDRPHENAGTHSGRKPPRQHDNDGADDVPPVGIGHGGTGREPEQHRRLRRRPDGWPPSKFG